MFRLFFPIVAAPCIAWQSQSWAQDETGDIVDTLIASNDAVCESTFGGDDDALFQCRLLGRTATLAMLDAMADDGPEREAALACLEAFEPEFAMIAYCMETEKSMIGEFDALAQRAKVTGNDATANCVGKYQLLVARIFCMEYFLKQ